VAVVDPLELDRLFAALADPTRREIIELLLASGELSIGEVAAPFAISGPAISRHLQVLERVGLIERRVERQWRIVRVRADALKPLEGWLARQQDYWTKALDRLEAAAAAQTHARKRS
jgi:DNA-binding transcriptional ArsR family regulator